MLDAKRDPLHPKDDEKEVLEPEVTYLSAIGAFLYSAQCTRPDISFAVNLLARHSNAPIRRHCNDVNDILRYLKVTTNLGLLCPYSSQNRSYPISLQNDICLVGYVGVGYLSDP